MKLTEEQLQLKRYQEHMKQWKLELEREELLARMNKASYDKMYYYLEGLDLMPAYTEKVKELEEKNKAIKAEQEKLFTEAANEVISENPGILNTDPE